MFWRSLENFRRLFRKMCRKFSKQKMRICRKKFLKLILAFLTVSGWSLEVPLDREDVRDSGLDGRSVGRIAGAMAGAAASPGGETMVGSSVGTSGDLARRISGLPATLELVDRGGGKISADPTFIASSDIFDTTKRLALRGGRVLDAPSGWEISRRGDVGEGSSLPLLLAVDGGGRGTKATSMGT